MTNTDTELLDIRLVCKRCHGCGVYFYAYLDGQYHCPACAEMERALHEAEALKPNEREEEEQLEGVAA